MGAEEEKIFIDSIQEKIEQLAGKTIKTNYYKIYSIVSVGFCIIIAIVFSSFYIGGKTNELKNDIEKWNGYGLEIKSHEESDAIIHSAMWKQISEIKGLLTYKNLSQLNKERAYYNDTVQVRTGN
jgi:hypothetical protein